MIFEAARAQKLSRRSGNDPRGGRSKGKTQVEHLSVVTNQKPLNTNHRAERSEIMMEHSDDYPIGRIKCVKTGGVCLV